jgi:hypothetical protein
MPITFDKTTPEFWLGITTANIISMRDEQAIEDSMEVGAGIRGFDYTVKSVKTITENDNLCKWVAIQLTHPNQDLLLLVKIVDTDVDISCYFEIPEVPASTREGAIANEFYWLFEEPANPDDFSLADLEFVGSITFTPNEDGDPIDYQMKPQGILHGPCHTQPQKSGMGKTFMTVVEYASDAECDNPRFLILEEGKIAHYQEDEDHDGGWMTFYMGCPINALEVDVL